MHPSSDFESPVKATSLGLGTSRASRAGPGANRYRAHSFLRLRKLPLFVQLSVLRVTSYLNVVANVWGLRTR